jgi:hypothetical protein
MHDFRQINNGLWGTNFIPSSIKVTYLLPNFTQGEGGHRQQDSLENTLPLLTKGNGLTK